jgi:hypothetical protein
MTMSISSAPALTASAVSASLTGRLARPLGNAVATAATLTPLLPRAALAVATMSPYTQTAAGRGVVGSLGSGTSALAARPRTLPGVSAPSSVVRSIIEMAVSIAQALLVVLIERVLRAAARASQPTWSTPGSPCSQLVRARLVSRLTPSRSRARSVGSTAVAVLTGGVYGRAVRQSRSAGAHVLHRRDPGRSPPADAPAYPHRPIGHTRYGPVRTPGDLLVDRGTRQGVVAASR